MHAEEMIWRRKVLEELIAAFSAWVLPPSEALPKVRAFAQARADEQGLVLLREVGFWQDDAAAGVVRSQEERLLAEGKVLHLMTAPDFLLELRTGHDAS